LCFLSVSGIVSPPPGLSFLNRPPSVQFLWGALLWDYPPFGGAFGGKQPHEHARLPTPLLYNKTDHTLKRCFLDENLLPPSGPVFSKSPTFGLIFVGRPPLGFGHSNPQLFYLCSFQKSGRSNSSSSSSSSHANRASARSATTAAHRLRRAGQPHGGSDPCGRLLHQLQLSSRLRRQYFRYVRRWPLPGSTNNGATRLHRCALQGAGAVRTPGRKAMNWSHLHMPGRPLQVRAAASQGQKAVPVGVDLGSFKMLFFFHSKSGPKLRNRRFLTAEPPCNRARSCCKEKV
jgi:hypothetical protein